MMTERIKTFLDTYKSIDWDDAHGRLKHLRNHGIAHLLVTKMNQSVSFGEVKDIVGKIGTLAFSLERLCHTPTALHERFAGDYKRFAIAALDSMKRPPA